MRVISIGGGAVFVAFALLVAAACGGSGSASVGTAPDAAPDGSTPVGTSAEAEGDADATDGAAAANDASCPLTYTAATGSCQGFASTSPSGSAPVCVYPEGTCRCAAPRCGGVVIPIDDPDAATSLVWRCTAPRTDGCPEQNPAGQACNDAKKTCSYPNGCCTDFATCNDGRWATRPGACPL